MKILGEDTGFSKALFDCVRGYLLQGPHIQTINPSLNSSMSVQLIILNLVMSLQLIRLLGTDTMEYKNNLDLTAIALLATNKVN